MRRYMLVMLGEKFEGYSRSATFLAGLRKYLQPMIAARAARQIAEKTNVDWPVAIGLVAPGSLDLVWGYILKEKVEEFPPVNDPLSTHSEKVEEAVEALAKEIVAHADGGGEFCLLLCTSAEVFVTHFGGWPWNGTAGVQIRFGGHLPGY